jgi:hypothetical protein
MPAVEVFEKDENAPLFVGEFDFLPRPGEHIATDAGGYFSYYNVIEAWHRETATAGVFRACVRVKLDD